jgi:hypothetical protein
MCVLVVTVMSTDIPFPINESLMALLMNIYCFHQGSGVCSETEDVNYNILAAICHHFLKTMHSDV